MREQVHQSKHILFNRNERKEIAINAKHYISPQIKLRTLRIPCDLSGKILQKKSILKEYDF